MKPYGLHRGDEPSDWYDYETGPRLYHHEWKRMTRVLRGPEMKKRARQRARKEIQDGPRQDQA